MDTKHEDSKMYREIKVSFINPLYAVGLVWVVYALFFPLYRFTDILIAGGLSLLGYLAAKRFIPKRTVVAPLTDKGALDKRCMEIIEKGYAYADQLKGFDGRMPDAAMREKITEIVAISRQMLDYTAKNPRIATDLQNFIDYYFPTTIKLLSTYADMNEQSLRSGNIEDIMGKVSAVMDTIVTAFRKQLDSMYAEKHLDIRVDVEVLKNVLAAEGLTEAYPGALTGKGDGNE